MSTATKAEARKTKASGRGPGTRYSAEFRREALRMVDAGKPVSAVSEELGVSVATLTQWRLKAQARAARGAEPGAAGESVTAENDRLRRELKTLKQELEIAKKAAAFFARHGA
jgi:transposase